MNNYKIVLQKRKVEYFTRWEWFLEYGMNDRILFVESFESLFELYVYSCTLNIQYMYMNIIDIEVHAGFDNHLESFVGYLRQHVT